MKTFENVALMGVMQRLDEKVTRYVEIRLVRETSGKRKNYWVMLNNVRVRPPQPLTDEQDGLQWYRSIYDLYKLSLTT